jgi:hypothetical protein
MSERRLRVAGRTSELSDYLAQVSNSHLTAEFSIPQVAGGMKVDSLGLLDLCMILWALLYNASYGT